ncbi:MerC domain-containing protein [Pseudidiomarina sediminum]|uniref:MerC domain-containing protein n=1 Tax=Pseudidiomarina sediminum TaxID=431675 RepID=A0A432Z3R0_9GAMM|nr:MerC domain-containing protein [Pseudidiomarina sediminum]MBY6062731.1 MerC domain-containing protein [Pseudidiomarina sediminum]RUO72538.1 MerC domain-containing protein [Pseudidiomarina sediminum]
MTRFQQVSDKAAIGLSFLCLLHCLLLPLLFIVVPSFAGIMALNDDLFHQWMLVLVVPVSAFALVVGYRHHRNAKVFASGAVGVSFMVIAALIGHDLLGHTGEIILTIIGSLIIAFSHFRNYRLNRTRACAIKP